MLVVPGIPVLRLTGDSEHDTRPTKIPDFGRLPTISALISDDSTDLELLIEGVLA